MRYLSVRSAIILAVFFVFLSLPAGATTYVRYDYTVHAESHLEALTDAAYLYDETFVEGEFTQVGNTGHGNYATVKFLADIASGRIFSYARAVGVQEDLYNFHGGTARVEHIKFRDELIFSIPAGTYPEGLYADLSGRMAGVYSSEVGAGAQISGWISLGSTVHETGILSVGLGDAETIQMDEPFTVTTMLAAPGSSYAVQTQVTRILSVYFHRNLCWAVEYNTGSGYEIGSAQNDFFGGIQIDALDPPDGVTWTSESGVFLSAVTAVDDVVPGFTPRLFQNHPNPFNPLTNLSFELAVAGQVRLKVYDAAGRLVATLADEHRDSGPHNIAWDGRDAEGRAAPAGVYLYRLESSGYVETKRMVLVK